MLRFSMALVQRIRSSARAVLERYDTRLAPRGFSLFIDLRRQIPGYQPRVMFDVGANVGQSAEAFLSAYPGARAFCFEPVNASFTELSQRFGQDERVRLFQMAMGADSGVADIAVAGTATGATLMTPATNDFHESESIEVGTLDAFCESEGVSAIDYLKIDTEGYDLEVLKGAERLLADGIPGVIEVETGMHPANNLHVPFEELKSHLEARGYRAFGFYEPVEEWTTGQPFLRRVNVAFIGPALYNAP